MYRTERLKEVEKLIQEYMYILTSSENPAQRVRADLELKKLRKEAETIKNEPKEESLPEITNE